jgi:hypothetical protein
MVKSTYIGWRFHTSDIQVPDVVEDGIERPRPAPARPIPYELRRARPADFLLPRTSAWILALPPRFRPLVLSRQYARIANQLCSTWDDHASCRKYFDSLLLDRRGSRQGFPQDILRELQLLHTYYETILLDKKGATVFD